MPTYTHKSTNKRGKKEKNKTHERSVSPGGRRGRASESEHEYMINGSISSYKRTNIPAKIRGRK